MTSLKFSIITCTYGRMQYINQMLGSIFSQSFPHDQFEVIIVNSRPDQKLIIDHEKYPQVKIFNLDQRPATLHEVHQIALSHCSGEWVTCLDDDDLWGIDVLRRYHEAIEENPHCQILLADHYFFASVTEIKSLRLGSLENLNVYHRQTLVDVGGYDGGEMAFDQHARAKMRRVSQMADVKITHPLSCFIYRWIGMNFHAFIARGVTNSDRMDAIKRIIDAQIAKGEQPSGNIELKPETECMQAWSDSAQLVWDAHLQKHVGLDFSARPHRRVNWNKGQIVKFLEGTQWDQYNRKQGLSADKDWHFDSERYFSAEFKMLYGIYWAVADDGVIHFDSHTAVIVDDGAAMIGFHPKGFDLWFRPMKRV